MHPENSPEINDLHKAVFSIDTCKVWCKGCNDWRTMNASYAKIIKTGEIESCSKCRD